MKAAMSRTPSTHLLRTDPARLDRLIGYGAGAARRCAPGPQKRYAFALGISRSRASRHFAGDPNSPETRLLVVIDRLARSPGTTAWPLIAEQIAVAEQAELKDTPTSELLRMLDELTDREHSLEAEENRETQRFERTRDHEACAAADIRKAEVHLARAAVRRELGERERRTAK